MGLAEHVFPVRVDEIGDAAPLQGEGDASGPWNSGEQWQRVDDLERMWADLAPVGRSARTGGYRRQPWTSAEGELRAWFEGQARERGLEVESDGIGNLLAWWRPEGVSGPAVLTGSHLDSVLDGGAYDGPLGVISGILAVDHFAKAGRKLPFGIDVLAFGDEEGSRFPATMATSMACASRSMCPMSLTVELPR